MSQQAVNAIVAVGLGSALAVVLLIPTAAVQYRRDGRLGPGDLVTLLGAAVYGLALWTYTLLPLPAGTYRCKVAQWHVFGTIGQIGLPERGLQPFLRDPAVLQVLFNVLLFVPLGYYVRVVLKRGVAVATLVGFAASLAIELTQYTAVWGIFGCAYRQLDVDDLLLNTVGALGGSLLSAVVVRRRSGDPRPLPSELTWGRRLMGLVCDALFVLLLGGLIAAAWRGATFFVLDTRPFRDEQWRVQWTVPFVLQAVLVLTQGRTVGELVVSVRARARHRWLAPLSRAVKLATGLAPVWCLVILPIPYRGGVLIGFLGTTVLAALLTPRHGGLSHAVARMRLEVVTPPGRAVEGAEDDVRSAV
ncbi:VanZ family protein [Nocardioides acrostichi]|uniref:VanZ family protein n=1 Tax=Nocardioides acrostichi TaxID=2784339 RepID=A0A930UWU2_9ACTN|nr:VanZ family protein [Nocardioides acrostichi]MBF4161127.1 VanZ family protein [Nocardioides acrostichi]